MTTRDELRAIFRRDEGVQYWFKSASGESSTCWSGLASRTPPSAVTPATTFHCFSTTKPVTALAVVQLAMLRRIDLEAPLSSYLPDLPYQNGATVRQVLSHQAGLPNPLPLAWVHGAADHATFDSEAFIARVVHKHHECGAPGLRARYSNIGFLLLGRLIELVSGLRYAEYVRRNILDVLALSATTAEAYLGFDIPTERHATGYTRRWSPVGMLLPLMPDAARLRSSEPGYIRYSPFFLDGAAYGGLMGNVAGWATLLSAIVSRDPQLLPAEGYAALFAPQALASGKPSGHALAWFVGKLRGHDYLCHAGGGPGYGSEIRIYPALGAASAFVSNETALHDRRLLDRLDATWLS